jgi:hypothetical protein
VRFADFLKATVLLSGGSATSLAAITAVGAARDGDAVVMIVCGVWWVAAAGIGIALGRRADASPPIARLLSAARAQQSLPELRPAQTLLNRLWALLVMTLAAGLLGVFTPQVAGIAAGFAIVWALAWRRQHFAVAAIEQRDAARFYVDRTSPVEPIRLVRTPGFGGEFLSTAEGAP